MRIAVAGGSGTVGRRLVDIAGRRGHDVRVLSRGTGVDLVSRRGVRGALDAVDAVIDVTSTSTLAAAPAIAFFGTTTRTLLTEERAASVPHHIALSIVGIDRAPVGYYAGKVAQERMIETGAVPWTILRATQFHEFAAQTYQRATIGPLHVAPRMRTQPVAAHEVAEHLVDLAEQEASGRVLDLAGPREEDLVEMIRGYARALGRRGWIPPISLPGASGRAQRNGSLLADADAVRGRQTFEEWLTLLRNR